jgi:hypothetical protein
MGIVNKEVAPYFEMISNAIKMKYKDILASGRRANARE